MDIQPLLSRIQETYPEHYHKILNGYQSERPVTLRVNPLKLSREDFCDRLSRRGIEYERVSYYEDAFILRGVRESALMQLPEYEQGAFYLQSLSSMLPPLYLSPNAKENILDMTAAPGGKTTQLYALSEGKALITACERDKMRFDRLSYNLNRQGATRVNAIKSDALQLNDFLRFDKILLDAPCTGTGTVQNGDNIRFSEEYLQKCTRLQKKLMEKAFRLLNKGGTLLYSTCSILPEENDEVVKRAISLGGKLQSVMPFDGITTLPSMPGTVCVCPDALYEGFFLAKIAK